MYRTIMVPLDGSPFSEQAVPLAVAVGHRTGAKLYLVHVEEPLFGEVSESISEQVRERLDFLARSISEEADISVTVGFLVGRVAEELIGYADQIDADLVIMTTHGRGGLSRAWLGSVADTLIRGSRIPVLALRPRDAAPRVDTKAIDHVLIPLDGSAMSEEVLDHALALGGPDVHYTLLQVIQLPIAVETVTVTSGFVLDPRMIEADRAKALEYLNRVAEGLEGRVRQVDTAVLVDPQPATAILAYAEQNDVDLIALATAGRTGVRRLILGSVADKVLRGASTPVLLYHPAGE